MQVLEDERERQQEKTKTDLRKNKIRIVKDKFKSSLHNQRFMENIMKVLYELEEIISQFAFLNVDVLKFNFIMYGGKKSYD